MFFLQSSIFITQKSSSNTAHVRSIISLDNFQKSQLIKLTHLSNSKAKKAEFPFHFSQFSNENLHHKV